MKQEQAAATRDKIAQSLSISNSAFDAYVHSGYHDDAAEHVAEWRLDAAFAMLAVWAESLGLPALLSEIQSDRKQAQAEGLNTETLDAFGEVDQRWAIPARRHLAAIEAVFVPTSSHVITRDLESILRASVYSITNTKVFSAPPRSESEVHLRLENILRPLFADLLHKPRLPKAIKNFEPDTGLPSIRTLI